MPSSSTFELKAIPTEYKGIQLKSRMEAQCAVLFDKLGWKWRYEPKSLMLPSGLTFMPDFWIEGKGIIAECRGYENERGVRQIDEFAEFVETGAVLDVCLGEEGESAGNFMVIGPTDSAIFSMHPSSKFYDGPVSQRERYQINPAIVARCGCGWEIPTPTFWCPNCEQVAADLRIISAKNGKVFLNGVLVEDLVLDNA